MDLTVEVRASDRLQEVFANLRERLAEWREEGVDVDREVLFDTSGLRGVAAAIQNPQMAQLFSRYAEEECRRVERQAIARMIAEAEEQIWCGNHEVLHSNPERGESDEGNTEGDGAERPHGDGVGHGSPGDSRYGESPLRRIASERAYWVRDLRDPCPQARGIRPGGRAHCHDDADGWRVAEERAEALLLEHLDEQQRCDWECQHRFTVTVPSGSRYLVQRRDSIVRNLDTDWAYCLQPTSIVPKADTALAHKLWLEADEAGFLEAANHFPPRNEWQGQNHPQCRCQMWFHLETVEQARAWAEARGWDVELTVDELPSIYSGVYAAWTETRYEVNGVVTDEHTVDMLRQAAAERSLPVRLPHLERLDCEFRPEIRRGCGCD